MPVQSGVPQGTVLGPLLFLVYINDLPGQVTSTVRLFADDCLLHRTISSIADQIELQRDLFALKRWCDTWGMRFNVDKCQIMHVWGNSTRISYFYTMNGAILQSVSQVKYLGV